LQHAVNLLVKVSFRDVPSVAPAEQIEVESVARGFWLVVAHYGFKDHPDIPDVVARLPALGVPVDPAAVSYFLTRSIIVPAPASARLFAPSMRDMALWRKALFAIAHRNSTSAANYYSLPGDLVIELGVQVFI
jgi:KUP system potassium uptake protein